MLGNVLWLRLPGGFHATGWFLPLGLHLVPSFDTECWTFPTRTRASSLFALELVPDAGELFFALVDLVKGKN